jgi:hypothetical protein
MSYLFIKKSVSKRKVCIIFIKNLKFKKKQKKTFLLGFLGGLFWVFWDGFSIANPCLQDQLSHAPAAREVGQALQAAHAVLGITRLQLRSHVGYNARLLVARGGGRFFHFTVQP